MNFCPTKYEIYASLLREHLQRRVLRKGFSENYVEKVKKIYIFETAMLGHSYEVDVFSFFDNLFSQMFIFATIKGASVSTKIKARKKVVLNLNAAAILLGMLCEKIAAGKRYDFVLKQEENFIKIIINGMLPNEEIKKTATLFGVTVFSEIICKKTVLIFPLKEEKTANEKTDFFSEIRLFMLFFRGCL